VNRRSFALSSLAALSSLFAHRSAGAQAAAPATALSPSQIMDRVQSVYDKARSFKASFKQKYTVQAYGDKTKDSSGFVIFEKPGKMSWRYSSNGNRVVSDGQLLKIYEKANKQLLEQPLDKSQLPAALSFLTGQGKLNQNFTFSEVKSAKYPTGYVLQGTPTQATATYDRVIFYVDAATFHVRRVVIIDVQRNRNSFEFTSAEMNKKPPTGEFHFTPPPGTQIIRP
jgi:outer membrane lipoprotein carrier protein